MVRLLLVEDDEMNRDLVGRRLKRLGFELYVAGDGEAAIHSANQNQPHLILMDLGLPVLDGWEATRRIKADPATAGIPIIALTAHAMAGDREKATHAGCDEYLTKPIDWTKLQAVLEEQLGRLKLSMPNLQATSSPTRLPVPLKPTPPKFASPDASLISPGGPVLSDKQRILIVEDNDVNRELLARKLIQEGYLVAEAANGRDGLEMIRTLRYDLVLLDIMMPELDGYAVLEQVKRDPATRDIPILMVSALDAMDSVVRCIQAGADDYLPKPYDPTLLRARVSACLEKKRLRNSELAYLRDVATLTATAAALERGEFTPESLSGIAKRNDALGTLARVFQSMVREVESRETRLRQQVQQLRVEIDEARKSTQVSEITETAYFQSLQEKVQNLRRRARSSG